MSGQAVSEVALLKRTPFVGRPDESRALKEALRRGRGGEGSAWLLEGDEGIGKTRLARWAEEVARTEGYEVRWGYGVREGMVPFLPFELMFRAPKREESRVKEAAGGTAGAVSSPVILFEEARPRRFWAKVEGVASKGPLIVATRERPALVKANRPGLVAAAAVLWITRLEGADHVAPGSLDALADRMEEHLRAAPGSFVAVEGLEYLSSQGGFLSVLRFLQFLRDVAQETNGQVLLSVNPVSLEPREVSLLEAESEVVADEAPAATPGPSAPSAPLSPTQMLLHLLSEVESASDRAPQLLVLDDVQWADLASQRAFQFLVRNTRDRRVVWLACLRSGEEAERHGRAAAGPDPFQEIREHMESEGALQRLMLRPLPSDDLRKLIQSSTEIPLDLEAGDPEFRDFLSRAAGNPQFALSSLRLLWEQGRLRHQGDRAVVAPAPFVHGLGASSALPENLRHAAEERLALLTPEERRFLALAALVGKDFDLGPIASRLGRTVEEIRSLARRLEALHGMVRSVAGGPDRWTFQDGTAWDAALSSLPPPVRREEARALGLWWSEHRPEDVEGVARLFWESGEAPLALPWIRKALEHAFVLHSADAAERYIEQVRSLSPSDPASVASRALEEVGWARSLRRIGSAPAAVRVLRALLPLELPPPVRRERDLALLTTLSDMDPGEARRRLALLKEDLARAAPEEVTSAFRANVAGSEAYLLLLEGSFEQGRKAAEEGLALLPSDAEERERARDHFTAGWCCMELGEWDAAERHFDASLSIGRQARLPSVEAAALVGLGSLDYLLGDLKGARRFYDEGLLVERAAGELQRTLPLLINLAEVAGAFGEVEKAWELQGEARRLSEKFDLAQWRATARAFEADLKARERKWGEAKQALQAATDAVKSQRTRTLQTQVRIGEAWVKGEMGDPAGALALLEGIPGGVEGIPAQYVDYYLQVRGRLKELAGDLAGARADLELARGRTGPSPHRQARILGDLSSWEGAHGTADRQKELRTVADRLYVASGVDPVLSRPINEIFPQPPASTAGRGDTAATSLLGPDRGSGPLIGA